MKSPKRLRLRPQLCWLNKNGLYVKPKAAFATKEEAEKKNKDQRAYLCPQCGKYHLTSQRQ